MMEQDDRTLGWARYQRAQQLSMAGVQAANRRIVGSRHSNLPLDDHALPSARCGCEHVDLSRTKIAIRQMFQLPRV